MGGGPERSRILLVPRQSGEGLVFPKGEVWPRRGAFIFPGQGAQYPGMGRELYDTSPAARMVFEQADKIVGFPLSQLCFNGSEEDLRMTRNTQLTSGVVDLAAHAAAVEKYPQLKDTLPVVGCGISFGELPNLVIAGVIDMETFFGLIYQRGNILEEAGAENPGTMISVLKLSQEKAEDICRQSGVYPAIYYYDTIVLSGTLANIEDAKRLGKEAGGRVIDTGVEYPFHTPLLQKAKERFRKELNSIPFLDPRYPVVVNPIAKATTSGEEIKSWLPEGLTSSVDATKVVAAAEFLGGGVFVEFCPRPVLSTHLKRGNPEVIAVPVHDSKSLQDLQLSFV